MGNPGSLPFEFYAANPQEKFAARTETERAFRDVLGYRTTVLLVRFRYHIITKEGDTENPLLAEDCKVLAFTGSPSNAQWLSDEQAEELLQAEPDENITKEQASDFIVKVIDDFDELRPHLDQKARDYGRELLDAHQRVRKASRMPGISYRAEPKLPPDVLGIYVYLPVMQGKT